MEDTNMPKGSVKVIWEILPGESGQIFREINLEDIDSNLFSPGPRINTDNFLTIPHPLLSPADDCLDRVWTQTVIKIISQSSFEKNEP